MKKLTFILIIALWAGVSSASAQCCDSKVAELTDAGAALLEQASEKGVKAYYFHATRRCVTCQAVEKVTKEALKEHYGDQVTFLSIDREKDSENPLLKKYKVSGQTLLVVSGDEVRNLTNDAFLNARTNPDKFKAKLKSTIDSMK